MITQQEANRLLWYGQYIKAKKLLTELSELDLDNLPTHKLEQLQIDVTKHLLETELKLQQYLIQYPDEKC